MGKNRLLSVFLALCILVSTFLPTYVLAADSAELKPVTLSLYSNLSSDHYLSGLYKDNAFFITIEDLCQLIGGKIVKKTGQEAIVNVGVREFIIIVGNLNMSETLYSDKNNIAMPSLLHDGQIYVSALHFLRYIGATVHMDETANVQFMVIKRYDIFDALEELVSSESGHFFWWDEVDVGNKDLEKRLINAGVVALINRDSNIFRMIFDAEGIQREAIEDALLSIVKNEGAGYFDEASTESELIETASGIIGAEADWFSLIKEAYQDTSKLGEQISDLADSAALTAGFANNVVNAVESLKQFDNISTIQKDILQKTILKHSEDSRTLCDGWNTIYDAAENVDAKVKSEYVARYSAALKVAESTSYDLLNGITGAAGANPVSIAWSGAILLTKLIPFTNDMIGKKDKLYNGYTCSMVQLIANEMLVGSYSDWYYNNGFYTDSIVQYETLDAVKQLMILQLKSTLTTREYLIQSGFLQESYISVMKQMNQETAFLLNKVENCKITGVNMYDSQYDENISWIMNYKEIDYGNLITDAYNGTINGRHFAIPKINIDSVDVSTINDEIWTNLYTDVVQEEMSWWEQSEYMDAEIIKYKWAVNNNVLSLCIEITPVHWAWWDYRVYNISIRTGKELSTEEVLSSVGLTENEYYNRVTQVLRSEFFQYKEDNLEQFLFDDFFNEQLENTLSDENIKRAIPYINNKCQLCIIACVYSIAGADLYWRDINIDEYELNSIYERYVQLQDEIANRDSIGDYYKAILYQYPKSSSGYTAKYMLYDIDKNGIPELIVKEGIAKHYVYSFDGTETFSCGEFYWFYDKCLYGYNGNGLIVYDGGMGREHLEYVALYTFENNRLEWTEMLKTSEDCSYDELRKYLSNYTLISDFHPINDYSYLPN